MEREFRVDRGPEPEPSKNEKEPVVCGDCGLPMLWDPTAARGGKYICLTCGNG